MNQWKEFNSSILTGKFKSTSGQKVSSGYSQFNGIFYFSINYTLADVINNGEAGVSVGDILKYEVTWMGIKEK